MSNPGSRLGQSNELIRAWEIDLGALHGYGRLTRDPADEDGPAIMMRALAIGNSKTNTLHSLWFASLEAEWERTRETGQRILERFVLDGELWESGCPATPCGAPVQPRTPRGPARRAG